MKKLILGLGLILAFSFGVQAQELITGPAIELDKDVHDYGDIENGGDGTCEFTVTNIGTEPLIISRCKGSCGCTVPSYPREPIKPGDTGEIEIVYSPGKQQGSQNKTITITANTNPISTTLNISANVEVVK